MAHERSTCNAIFVDVKDIKKAENIWIIDPIKNTSKKKAVTLLFFASFIIFP